MLILGSSSPRRKEILKLARIPFKVKVSNAKEDVNEQDPVSFVKKTALEKAKLISISDNDVLLCCDTIVYIDNKILGKPKNKDEAYKMINLIQGRNHLVCTGVYLGNNKQYELFSVETVVTVSKMSRDEILEYINTDEPYDKAGGYAIQGLFSKYIEKINGDYYNVMGLPLNEVCKRLKKYNLFKEEL